MEYDAEHFDELYRSGDGDPWEFYDSSYEARKYDRTLGVAVDRRPASEVDSILELGCGNGAFTTRLTDAYPDADVLGVDISEVALDVARERVERATFECAEMVEWVTDCTETFDIVFASECLYYPAANVTLTEFVEFTRQLAQLVAVGGYLVSATIHREPDGAVSNEDRRVVHTIRTALEGHLDTAGRRRYSDTKREDGTTREYTYEIWTFR